MSGQPERDNRELCRTTGDTEDPARELLAVEFVLHIIALPAGPPSAVRLRRALNALHWACGLRRTLISEAPRPPAAEPETPAQSTRYSHSIANTSAPARALWTAKSGRTGTP